MIGRSITEVNFHEPEFWVFCFGADGGVESVAHADASTSVEVAARIGASAGAKASISVECPWRILQNGRIALSYDDHGQQFGLPEPIDGAEEAVQILSASPITGVQLREGTADLVIVGSSWRLEIIPFSSGYESWQMQDPFGNSFVAQGGGEVSAWKAVPSG